MPVAAHAKRSSRAHGFRPSHIRLQCRDFAFVCIYFASETDARETFESIRNFTCKLGRIERLYAFTYQPRGKEAAIDGWRLYDAQREWHRMGADRRGWRISRINSDYRFCPTYPALLPVPASISDNTLNYAGRYRSRARIPVLTYLHPVNNCSITRSSQPMTGIRQHRSAQDEKLLAEIFMTTSSRQAYQGATDTASNTAVRSPTASSRASTPGFAFDELGNAEEMEDALISSIRHTAAASPPPQSSQDTTQDHSQPPEHAGPPIYGAQQNNLIVDARPTVNAMAMQAMGAGSENMDSYPFATKAYLGIDNIHVMRDSLCKVYDALKDADISPLPPSKELLAKSNWLKHVGAILDGASLIARQVGLNHSHVLIHCSDGWDRTSQLSALSQICLEPYYRTLEGFIVLIEKDWLAFGHNFRLRGGVLGSKDWFKAEGGGMSMPSLGAARDSDDWQESDGGPSVGRAAVGGASKAIGNAISSARGFFNRAGSERRGDKSRRETPDDHIMTTVEASESGSSTRAPSVSAATSAAATPAAPASAPSYKQSQYEVVNSKETSPVFHQFLDATYQLLYQHPDRFEFNERFLRRLLYHSHSAQYGTFLFNSEKERVDMQAAARTHSVWSYFLARREEFINPTYDATVDDKCRGKERLLFPNRDHVRWWSECFNRPDAEMNSPVPSPSARPQHRDAARQDSVLAGVEAAGVSRSTEQHPSGMMPGNLDIGATMSTGFAAIAAGLSSLGLTGGGAAGGAAGGDATTAAATETESEPQQDSGSQQESQPLGPEKDAKSCENGQETSQQGQSQPPTMQDHRQPAQSQQAGDGLEPPAFFRDPLAEEIRELYAKLRQASPRVAQARGGGEMPDGSGGGQEAVLSDAGTDQYPSQQPCVSGADADDPLGSSHLWAS
ncbi:hypothetical protein KEM52_000803 [Ascosphaera acerosa]|nr:hypothetical protein KEM52_000803 [Ascosphaera acerosa]